jgi:hypothetical protein
MKNKIKGGAALSHESEIHYSEIDDSILKNSKEYLKIYTPINNPFIVFSRLIKNNIEKDKEKPSNPKILESDIFLENDTLVENLKYKNEKNIKEITT